MLFFEIRGVVEEDVWLEYEFALCYHLPNALSFEKRLKRLIDDVFVGEMSKVNAENRALSVYVVNDKDDEKLILEISKSIGSIKVSTVGNRKKMTLKRASKAKVVPLTQDSFSENFGPHNINKKQATHPKVIFMLKKQTSTYLFTPQTYLQNQMQPLNLNSTNLMFLNIIFLKMS